MHQQYFGFILIPRCENISTFWPSSISTISKRQAKLDFFLRRCNQDFEIRPVTCRLDLDRVLYAQQFIMGEWCRKRERISSAVITWEMFTSTPQEYIALQRIRMLDIGKELRDCKQRPKQTVSQLVAHIDSLEDQLSAVPPGFVRVNQLVFSLHPYIQTATVRKREPCNTRLEVEEAALLIERIEDNPDMSYTDFLQDH